MERSNQLEEETERLVKPILNVYDESRKLFTGENKILEALKTTIPQIVVIGSQSVGKTSVLEGIAGIDLPKGAGTVTKTPLQIELRSLSNDDHSIREYAEIRKDTMSNP